MSDGRSDQGPPPHEPGPDWVMQTPKPIELPPIDDEAEAATKKPVRERGNVLLRLGLGAQNDKLVSADAILRLGRDHDLRDTLSNFDEDGIADGVPVSVVNLFEPIEIDEHDADRRCGFGFALTADRVEEGLSIT